MRFAFSSSVHSRRITSASLVGLFLVSLLAARPDEAAGRERVRGTSPKSRPEIPHTSDEVSIDTRAAAGRLPTIQPVRSTMTACSQLFEIISPCTSTKSIAVGAQLSITYIFTNNTPETVGVSPTLSALAILHLCAVSPSFISVPSNQSKNFSVTCTGAAVGTGTLTVFSDDVSATVAVTVTSPPALSITPKGAPVIVLPNTLNRQVFTMQNLTTSIDTVDVVTACTTYSCTLQTPSPLVIAANGSLPDTVQYTSGAIGSSATIGLQGTVRNKSTVDVGTVVASVPTPVAPYVDLTPHNGDNHLVGLCVASCFDVMASYSTPSYTSMDKPRSATLVYSSAQAAPLGLIQVDVTDQSARPAQKLSIQLRQSNGSAVTFTNGSTELFFKQDSAAPTRLAGQFSATSLGTGAQIDTVVVKSYWTTGADAGTVMQTAYPVAILIQNRQQSAFGVGWTLAGQQRVYIVPGDSTSILVADGAGSITRFFQPCQACMATALAADFSTLIRTQTLLGTITGYLRTYRDGSTAVFNTAGYLTSSQDRFADTTKFAYDASNVLQTITDPAGKVLTFGYVSGKLSTITDPNGRVSTFSVNASNDLASIKDPTNTLTFQGTYDASHRLTQVTDRGSNTWKYVYDFASKLASDSTPSILVDTTTSGAGSLVNVRLGSKVVSLESAILIDPASGKGTSANPASQVLSAKVRAALYGMPLETTTAHVTRYALDRFLAPLRIEQDSLADTTFLTRDMNEHVTRTLERRKQRTVASDSSVYNGPRLVQSINEITGASISYTYDLTYDLVKHISGSTQTVQDYFDATKIRIDSMRVGSNADSTKDSVSIFVHDARGRVTKSIDPKKDTVITYYGSTGFQNTDSVRAGTRTTRFRYDNWGRLVRTVNPHGDSAIVALDKLNRTDTVYAPGARSVSTYDSLSRVVQITDPRGQVYATRYNPLGWVNATIDAATGDPAANRKDSLEYTKTGAVRKNINRRLQATVTKFDHRGRDSTLTLADGRVTTFTYDPTGLWAAVANGESIDTVSTDTAGLVQKQISRRGTSRYVVTATSDMSGLLRSRVFTMGTDPTSLQTVSYGYDAEWRLDTLSVGTQRTFFGYNADGILAFVKLTQHSGATLDSMTYAVTGVHQNYSVNHSAAGLQVFNTGYTRDSLEHITQRTNRLGDTAWTYAYNAPGELTSYKTLYYSGGETCVPDPHYMDGQHCTGTGPTTLQSTTYAYDSVGNRTDGSPTIVAGNRLTSWNADTLTYDYDGNLTRKIAPGLNQFLYWNSIGQLDSVKTNGALVSFGYDGTRRRVRKTVGSAIYKYIYDGNQILTIDSSGTRLLTYSYYPGVDKPHSVITSAGKRYYYLSETGTGAGSVRGIIDTVGGIKNRYRYAPFGASEVTSEQVVNPFRFAGREYDSETQLYYNRARYYDPSLARFISEDPTGLSSDINQYRYAADDPINANDPSGTMNASDEYEMMMSRGDLEPHGITSFGYSMDDGMSWDEWAMQIAEIETAFAEEEQHSKGIPFVVKHYGEVLDCNQNSTQVMSAVTSDFSRFGDYSAGPLSVAFSTPSALTVGSSVPISVGIGPFTQNLSVKVTTVTPQSLSFSTDPGHLLYPATITFSSYDASASAINFNINLAGTVSGLHLLEFIAGGGAFENKQWNNFVKQVGNYCSETH